METLIGILTNNALLTAFGPIAVIALLVAFVFYRQSRQDRKKVDELNDLRISDVKESNARYETLIEKIRETLQKLLPQGK